MAQQIERNRSNGRGVARYGGVSEIVGTILRLTFAAFVICWLQVNGYKIEAAYRELGYEAVTICTPEELMEV